MYYSGRIKCGYIILVRVRLFGIIQDWILKFQNGFCVSLLNRLIQDHSDHGSSKAVKYHSGQGLLGSFDFP